VKAFEWGLAALLAAGGVRSAWYWLGRPFEAADVADHALFALFVTARVGLWFAFAGLFAISASSDAQGRAFADEFAEFRWYVAVLIALSAVQFVTGLFLARRRQGPDPDRRASASDDGRKTTG
jgi:cbb3-type cytochrome oxidase subunit 1